MKFTMKQVLHTNKIQAEEIAALKAELKLQTEALGETLAEVMGQRDALKSQLAAANMTNYRTRADEAESRASSLEGRLEAAMKVAKNVLEDNGGPIDGEIDGEWMEDGYVMVLRMDFKELECLYKSFMALDETGGRAK